MRAERVLPVALGPVNAQRVLVYCHAVVVVTFLPRDAQNLAGEGEHQLVLPPPPGTVPYYDVIYILGQGSFSFGDADLKYLNGSSPST